MFPIFRLFLDHTHFRCGRLVPIRARSEQVVELRDRVLPAT